MPLRETFHCARNALTGLVAAAALVGATTARAEATHEWAYSGPKGPDRWGSLTADFEACASGKMQSPVNLTGFQKGDHAELAVDYRPGGTRILNNGHTVQVNYAPGSAISVDDHRYELIQFHFHAPSENTIEGHSYPMEAHFVHADESGNLAVVAVLVRAGKRHAELDRAWQHMPTKAGMSRELPALADARAILPRGRAYYGFDGSLTTPPCTEGVRWFVMAQAITASEAQIEAFSHAIHHPNNRPVQPLHARSVTR